MRHLLGTARAPRDRHSPAREAKRRVSSAVTTRLVNPVVRSLVERGAFPSNWVVLETIGRRSGQPRRTPVGDGLRGDTFWIVTEHGWRANYVRNILANPRVRICRRGRWRTGTAHVLPEEDPYALLRRLGRPLNDALLLLVGTEQLVVRVDLDPQV